ncbi:hypothetical protein, partial [Ralstonia pseudosolanacearum]|uniref:hypothetical protein n=1 Tax=Ralstonia pseudosolanacearum TaxID=1310165 RepID=UPI001FFA49D6
IGLPLPPGENPGHWLVQHQAQTSLISASLEDSDRFFHWSYRERSLNNLSPKIKTSGALMINQGVAKALDKCSRKIDLKFGAVAG